MAEAAGKWSIVVHGGAGLDKGTVLAFPEVDYQHTLTAAILAARDVLIKVSKKIRCETMLPENFKQFVVIAEQPVGVWVGLHHVILTVVLFVSC